MNVEKLMNRAVKTCSPTDTLDTVAKIMWEGDCGIVPIVTDEGRIVGVITDRDICMAAYTQAKLLSHIPASSIASKTVHSVRPADAIEAAEDLMKKEKVRRLAVTENGGRLVGILSLNDLARHAGQRTDDLSTTEVTQTLSAICQPRSLPRAATAAKPSA